MDKCPYCGAQLQENAHFCLYCMRSLQDKQNITLFVNRKKKRTWTAAVCTGILAVLVLAVLLIPGLFPVAPENDAELQLICPEITYEPIIVTEDFIYSASMQSLTGGADIWEPFWLSYLEPYGDWEKLSTALHIDQAEFYLYFLNGGTHVFASVTGLTDSDLEKGIRLVNEITTLVYKGETHAQTALLTEEHFYPQQKVEGLTLLQLINMEDTAAKKVTLETPSYSRLKLWASNSNYMLYELRTRTYQGQTYYDIYVFYGQE